MFRTAPTKLSAALLIVIVALSALPKEGVSTQRETLSATSAVCLNELLPKPCGEVSEEFIELYNPVTATVVISGWVLRAGINCSIDQSTPYTLSAGTVISGTSHMVLSHTLTGLTLPDASGCVLLLDDEGVSVDEKSYVSPQCAIGRCPDGSSIWQDNLPPSPGEANTCSTVTPTPSPTGTPTATATATPSSTSTPKPTATNTATPTATATDTPTASPTPTPTATATATPSPSSTPTETATSTLTPTATASVTPSPTLSVLGRVCISEFLPAPKAVDWDGDGQKSPMDEWIELHNESAQDLDLGGCMLDDVAGEQSYPFVIREGTMLLAGEYRVFYRCDTHVILNNEGDSVRLLAPDGAVVDAFDYEHTDYDVSYSRSQGCEGEWVSGWPPSPGEPNSSPTPLPTSTPGMQLYLPLIKRA